MSDLATFEDNHAIAPSPPPLGPLSVLLSPSGQYAVEAGESFDISLTLHNQGGRGAVIDVYIDETSQVFCQWCLNPYERLALEVGNSCEVRFKVTIPVQTLPGAYDYLIVVDAPDHYPEDTPLRYAATVQVLPPVKAAVNLNDATFALRPETRSDQPAALEPATPLDVQVVVHNRSDRVDQFRLEITDLPGSWHRVIYPEGLGELGLILDSDHLALNPGAKGRIQIVITAPVTVLAGRYLATVRLYSANAPDLVLMDVLYLEVPSVYDLTVRPEAIIRKVKRQAALFHLHITNAGNTARDITLQAQEDREDPLFTYRIQPSQLRVPSMTTAQATLTANPAHLGRRAWIGRGRSVTFRLVVDDHHALPLPEATTAELLWERRPWWHLALIILLGAGIVSAIAAILWQLFIRPPTPPKVTEFDSAAPTYYQQQNDFVRLNWRIENPKHIQALELRSQAGEGAIATQPVTYDLSEGLPRELSQHCVLERTLSCSNVLTSARQPGSYQFTLTVLPKVDQAEPVTAQTVAIAILPTPPPEILTFAATQPRYWESLDPSVLTADTPSSDQAPNAAALNWRITFAGPLSHLTLVGRLADGSPLASPQQYDLSEGLPDPLQDACTLTATELTCRNLPTRARAVGTYVFELSVFVPDSSEPAAIAKTDPIQIVPMPVRIETFTVNGEPAPAKYQVQEPSDADAAQTSTSPNTVELAWRIVGGPYTRVEILPTPGSVPLVGNLAYPLTENAQEVVTLQVTSVRGEHITRSVTLDTVRPEIPLSPPPAMVETTLPPPPPGPAAPETAAPSRPEPVSETPEEGRSPVAPQTPVKPSSPPPKKPSPTQGP